MNEKLELSTKPIDVLFKEWLQENNVTCNIVAVAPKGERLSLGNFLLAGWGVMIEFSNMERK